MKIAYTYVAVDVFHYGHLRLLEHAKRVADFHFCGLLTDDVCLNWNGNLVMNYEERLGVLNALTCIDKVIEQSSIDPTQNLKKIHEDHPDAEIILFQGHQDWKSMPGTEYVRSINGKVIKPEFYPRLSRTFIREELNKLGENLDLEGYLLGNISFFSLNDTSKANTLKSLKPLLKKSIIEKLFVFKTSQWKDSHSEIVQSIQAQFNGKIVVRSSAMSEDTRFSSNAGFFHSEINVDSEDDDQIHQAVSNVIASYAKQQASSDDQILVQTHTQDVVTSGVLFTRDIQYGSPYYLINHDPSGATDSVTSGLIGEKIEILRNATTQNIPELWQPLIDATKEIEELLQDLALDIEFAIKESGDVVIFQVRPFAAMQRFEDLPDQEIFETIGQTKLRYEECSQNSIHSTSYTLSDMSFWNPAEIIGDRADNLSYSFYRYLILNHAWNKGLVPLGYNALDRDLMIRLGNKPYIEVETACAALLPASVSKPVQEKLITYYIGKLKDSPELHDKIEFDVVHNCYAPTTDVQLEELRPILNDEEFGAFRLCLIQLTQKIFDSYEQNKKADLHALALLEKRRKEKMDAYDDLGPSQKIALAIELLDDAAELGTPQFSRMARLAFIGTQYLFGFVNKDLIDRSLAERYLQSIDTVATDLSRDFNLVILGKLAAEQFNLKYGHLRPGTYDITKLPYHKNPDYFTPDSALSRLEHVKEKEDEDLNLIKDPVEKYLQSFEISISADFILGFIKETTQYRELFKFEFSKNLSMALEILADVGETLGFSREMLVHLPVEVIKGVSSLTNTMEIVDIWDSQIQGAKARTHLLHHISMPSLIFCANDFTAVHSYSARPNFISSQSIIGEIIDVEALAPGDYDRVSGKIVLLEKADPGYDWIFSKDILGLITRFGGAASHMAIRCAEFGLPAAIGCGEILYNALKTKSMVQLDCVKKSVEMIK